MLRFTHKILAAFLLVMLTLSGQFSPCACTITPPSSPCSDHDHRDTDPAHEQQCPCPTCHHACEHHTMALSEIASPEYDLYIGRASFPPMAAQSPSSVPCEIFTPPKLRA